jgi:hypothetical protein
MATLTKGKTFSNGELVTPANLHALVDSATVANIVNADIAANAAIADTKLATISTANKVAQSAVTNLTTDLAGKAASIHQHAIADTTGLQTALDGKQASGSYAPATGIAPSAITGTAVITTDSRLSDARPPLSHTHDDRYYTETEMNTLLAGKQASGSYAPATGIAATAITGTAVITTDSRLSDARTPTSHTHDDRYYTETEIDTKLSGLPVSGHTHTIANVTGLQTALDGKQASGSYAAASHTHDASAITSGTLANARTTATSANTANAIVARDASGDFSAGKINGVTVGMGGGSQFTNTAVGYNSLLVNFPGGSTNTAVGSFSLLANTLGSYNVAIGGNALLNNTTGNGNTAIGAQALEVGNNFSNCSGVGHFAQVTGSNQVQLGRSTATTYAYGAVQDRSDVRDKADIRDTTLGLDFVKALRPVDFRWDYREDYRPFAPTLPAQDASAEEKAAYKAALNKWQEDVKLANITHDGSKKRNRYHHGLIAQEVKAVLDAQGLDFGGYQDHSIKGGDDVLSLGYEELIAPLIKAVQELAAEVAALKAGK